MRILSRTSTIILTLTLTLQITPSTARQTPTSYCKCICFQNSTIIPLNSPPDQKPAPIDPSPDIRPRAAPSSPNFARDEPILSPSFQTHKRVDSDTDENGSDSSDDSEDNPNDNKQQHHHTLTCADCNRAFCQDYNLPICKGASQEDIFTSCFQRDSVKDETVVLLFILLTASLLSWAVLKPWIDKVRDGGGSTLSSFVPLASSSSGRSDSQHGSNAARGARAGISGEALLPRTERSSYRGGHQNGNARDRGDSDSIARQGGLNS